MKSIGQVFLTERKKRRLTLENVQKAIKIHPKYIKAMESDDYSVFDGKIHAKGFLKIYADFLDLNVSEILALWRRDYETDFEKQKLETKGKYETLKSSKIILTPTVLFTTVLIVLILGFFGYLYYQYKTYNSAPNLEISHPENNLITENSVVDITGKTDLDCTIFVNNQKVVLGMDGNFATSVKINEGINTLSIISVNKLDMKTEIVRTVIYRPKEIAPPQTTPSSTEINF